MNNPFIIADQNMPFIKAYLGHLGEVKLIPGRDINCQTIKGAEILLVRSVTEVNSDLLQGSAVRFVGSATAGTDHIDLEYLEKNNIQFAHAPGCNSEAVVQYVLSVFSYLKPEWQQSKVGIVGCGNVGGRLYQKLCSLGIECQVYDPLLTTTQIPDLVAFDKILDCDIISLHTPLTTVGDFPTYHMFNQQVLEQLKPDSLLINAGRGAVIDNTALVKTLKQPNNPQVALDVWESEPQINEHLLDLVSIATPHIAGYTIEGKLRGTTMLSEALANYLSNYSTQSTSILNDTLKVPLNSSGRDLNKLLLACYNVADDDQRMRKTLQSGNLAEGFDLLRKNYPQRREYSHFKVSVNSPIYTELNLLGFSSG